MKLRIPRMENLEGEDALGLRYGKRRNFAGTMDKGISDSTLNAA